jgi:hypothetical protein
MAFRKSFGAVSQLARKRFAARTCRWSLQEAAIERKEQGMNDNSDVNFEPPTDDDVGGEINIFRLSCITQIISARPITVRLVAVLLPQAPQPERKKRRTRNVVEGKGGDA